MCVHAHAHMSPPTRTPQIWHQRKQVFLGSFSTPQRAAIAFDLASIKMRPVRSKNKPPPTNFPLENYTQELNNRNMVGGLRA